jgi:hypothetical protein
MRSMRTAVVVLFCLLFVSSTTETAGFSDVDNDHDGLSDELEQAILEKFRPTWNISATDCNVLPAQFVPYVSSPVVLDRNGTIYGQVFIRDANSLGLFVEAHFYDLWAADCGYINSHPFDAEHVSVLIRVAAASQPLSEWHATQWYAAAHEDTICDSSSFAWAASVNGEDQGPTIWVSRGKHGAFFGQQPCARGGCSFDRCETAVVALNSLPINIGEVNASLNGAGWTATTAWPLTAKMRSDFPNVTTFSSLSYSLQARGSASTTSAGSPRSTVTGYAALRNTDGGPAPAGVSIFGVRRNNVLITEAAVPNSARLDSGRLYAEVGGRVNTGLAMANPSDETARVAFYFTDTNGRSFGHNSLTLQPRTVIGRFLDESPFNAGSSFRGTFTFTSSLPVSAVAIRLFDNERSDFLLTTLPVTPLPASENQTVVFPQIADGEGWTTQFVLVNPTDSELAGTLDFFSQGDAAASAEPLILTMNREPVSSVNYSIPPQSAWVGTTAGSNPGTRVGSARVRPLAPSATPSGVAIFSFRRNGIVTTESGVPAMAAGTAFRLFVESSGNFDSMEPGSLQTGIAIANLANAPAAVKLEWSSAAGRPASEHGELWLPARGQAAMFVSQLAAALPSPFQGMLRISTTGNSGAISVVGLRGRFNERGDFLIATTPAVNENVPGPAEDTFFPYLADGGGYTTQFILVGSPADTVSTGWLRFFSTAGTPVSLTLRE